MVALMLHPGLRSAHCASASGDQRARVFLVVRCGGSHEGVGSQSWLNAGVAHTAPAHLVEEPFSRCRHGQHNSSSAQLAVQVQWHTCCISVCSSFLSHYIIVASCARQVLQVVGQPNSHLLFLLR
jgi:hypothetical protein